MIYSSGPSFSASSLCRVLLHGDVMRILTRSTCATPITTIQSLRSPPPNGIDTEKVCIAEDMKT